MANNYDELVADFQQYYNFDATKISEDNFERACILAAQLPAGSRIMREQDSSLTWDNITALLANIEYEMRVLLYSMSKKGSRGKKPKPLSPPPNKREKKKEKEEQLVMNGQKLEVLPIDELKSRLQID